MSRFSNITAPFQKLFAFFGKLSTSSATGDPEVMRFVALYGVIAISVLSLVALLTKGVWDPLATGGAFGLTTGGAGAGSAAKNLINRRPAVKVAGDLNAENVEHVETQAGGEAG